MASFDDVEKAGQAVADIIAAGIIPAGPGDDGPARRRTRSSSSCTRATTSTPPRSCCANPTARREEVEDEIARMKAVLRARRRDAHDACRATRPSGCASGPGARRRFPAVGRISPDYYCMDGTIPRKRLGEVLDLHRRDGEEVRPALPERVPRRRRQPASADPVRRQRRRASCSAPSSSPPRCWRNASRSAAPSPASTAWASRRSTRCACSSAPDELELFLAVKRAFDPAGPAQSRARRCRRSRAAPSSAACTCAAAQLPHPELPRF